MTLESTLAGTWHPGSEREIREQGWTAADFALLVVLVALKGRNMMIVHKRRKRK